MFLVCLNRCVFGGGHVRSAANCLIKDRRIITTVKINVGFGKKMVGKKLPAITHYDVKQTA